MSVVIYNIVLFKQHDQNQLEKEKVHFILQLGKSGKELIREPGGRHWNKEHGWAWHTGLLSLVYPACPRVALPPTPIISQEDAL